MTRPKVAAACLKALAEKISEYSACWSTSINSGRELLGVFVTVCGYGDSYKDKDFTPEEKRGMEEIDFSCSISYLRLKDVRCIERKITAGNGISTYVTDMGGYGDNANRIVPLGELEKLDQELCEIAMKHEKLYKTAITEKEPNTTRPVPA